LRLLINNAKLPLLLKATSDATVTTTGNNAIIVYLYQLQRELLLPNIDIIIMQQTFRDLEDKY